MKLRFVTYNIHKGRGADQLLRLDRIVELLRRLEPDVVALQEVFQNDRPREDVACQAAYLSQALELPHFAVACNVPRRTGLYGNATLSRFPLSEREPIDLTWWVKKRRTALYTKVRAPTGEVHLFNVHLGLAHVERMQQMRRLVDHLDARTEASEPMLIVGDTNDWYGRLHGRVLRDAGFDCAFDRMERKQRATFPSWLPVGKLDRVFCRGSLQLIDTRRAVMPLARIASDHLPLIVDLEIADA